MVDSYGSTRPVVDVMLRDEPTNNLRPRFRSLLGSGDLFTAEMAADPFCETRLPASLWNPAS